MKKEREIILIVRFNNIIINLGAVYSGGDSNDGDGELCGIFRFQKY
jgi:hypothetical protein